jgi:hypothetical protein
VVITSTANALLQQCLSITALEFTSFPARNDDQLDKPAAAVVLGRLLLFKLSSDCPAFSFRICLQPLC